MSRSTRRFEGSSIVRKLVAMGWCWRMAPDQIPVLLYRQRWLERSEAWALRCCAAIFPFGKRVLSARRGRETLSAIAMGSGMRLRRCGNWAADGYFWEDTP